MPKAFDVDFLEQHGIEDGAVASVLSVQRGNLVWILEVCAQRSCVGSQCALAAVHASQPILPRAACECDGVDQRAPPDSQSTTAIGNKTISGPNSR